MPERDRTKGFGELRFPDVCEDPRGWALGGSKEKDEKEREGEEGLQTTFIPASPTNFALLLCMYPHYCDAPVPVP